MTNLKNPINFDVKHIIGINADGTAAEVKLGDCFRLLSGTTPAIKPEKNLRDKTFNNQGDYNVRKFILTDIATGEVINLVSYYENSNGPQSRFFLPLEVAKKFQVRASNRINNLEESPYKIAEFTPTAEQIAYLERKNQVQA